MQKYFCDVITNSSSELILLLYLALSFFLTSMGIQSASATLNLISAFVLTLFTFCPPGPPNNFKTFRKLT